MPDDLVLEAPVEAPVLEPEPEPEGGEPEAPAETPQEGTPEKPGIPSSPKEVHQGVRASLAEIRAKNPAVAEALKGAYYDAQNLRREFPGGLPEVVQLKQAVTQYGGVEQIQERMGELDFFKQLDNDFTSAKPEVWDRLSDAAPEQFVKLFPSMTEKIEHMAPEAFASWFAARSMADLDQFGLRQDIQWLLRVAGENAEVKGIAEKFSAYFTRLGGFASKPFAAPKGQTPTQGADATSQRERDLNIREFRGEHQQVASQMYGSELGKHLAGRQVSSEQKAAIMELVNAALNRAETADDRKKMDRYFAAGDKKGYLAFKRSILDRAMPKAVESAVAVTIGRKPGTKPASAITPKPVNGRPAPVAAQGIKQVNAEPERNSVKWGRNGTSPADVLKGIYTLHDGTRVQWRG